jgi:hypothetical protein
LADAAKTPRPPCLLPRLVEPEPLAKRWGFGIILYFFVVAFLVAMRIYWVPANPGVDQNGYLVGGKMFAEHWTMGYTPPDPFCFVGRMWITVDGATFYPKYPLGLPFLYAVALWIGGASYGVYLAHLIPPVAMTLSLVGAYLLFRQVLQVFPSMLGVVALAVSPVTLELADNPNSHAATLCCVVWGMYFLVRWWRGESLWWARAAGLLVGYAATIRYTEGLLVIPLILVAAMRSRSLWDWRDAGALLLWWAIPIGVLVTFNLCWFGHLTGYDPTNESTGFSFANFQNNWQTMLRTMYDNGLIFIFPFAIAGLVGMFWWNWRMALMLSGWVAPSLMLYTAYYWAPDSPSTAYIRFFLTILPPLVLGAMWLITRLFPEDSTRSKSAQLGLPFVGGVVVALGGAMGIYAAAPQLDNLYRTNFSTYTTGQHALASIPAGSFVFGEGHVLHHLQFIEDYRLYSLDMFRRDRLRLMVNADPDRPDPFQRDRAQALYDMMKDQSDASLAKHQDYLMCLANTLDHRVFLIGQEHDRLFEETRRRIENNPQMTVQVVDQWSDAAAPLAKSFDRVRNRNGWNMVPRAMATTPAVPWVILEVTAHPDFHPAVDISKHRNQHAGR